MRIHALWGTLVLLLATASIAPAQLTPDDRYTLYANDALVSPSDTVQVTLRIDSVAGTGGSPQQIDGWSFGFCHDPTALTIDTVVHSPLVQALNGGAPLAFSAITLYPSGFTDGVLIDFMGINTLPQGVGYPLYEVTYEASDTPGTTTLDFCELGTPPVLAIVATGSTDNVPVRETTTIEVLGAPYFIRGDCDNNTGVNIADTIFLLQQTFPPAGGPPAMACMDACDCNDDGTLNISDAIWMLNAVLGNPSVPLPGPYPDCGEDVAEDGIDCAASISGCP
ncbi:MAG: hypothetical protein AAF581_09495 [Planctomycetota bacterium]